MNLVQITNANLIDPAEGTVIEGATLVLENGRVAAAGKEVSRAARTSIDVKGAYVMPGLIDAHVHAYLTHMDLGALGGRPMSLHAHEASDILEGMLRRGFTTVRDAAGADWGLAAAVDRGLIKGPRIYFSGRAISQTGGHGDFRSIQDDPPICACGANTSLMSHVVDGVDAVRAAVRTELKRGAKQIKLMASGGVASPSDPLMSLQMSPEEMAVASQEAADWGTYTLAHAYAPEAIKRAVEAGVRTIEHGNLLDRDVAKIMAKNKAYLVPTLVTYHTLKEIGKEAGFPEVSLAKLGAVLDAGLASLEIAKKAGVRMGFGTDLLGPAHPQQCREFTIRGEALSPLEVIQSATTVNADILRAKGDLGTLAVGARADVIVLDANPLEDLGVLAEPETHLKMVMKDGVVMHDWR